MCETQQPSVWGWRGAASGIRQRMQHILETGECSDAQFAVGHQYGMEQVQFFRVHKFVLRVSSDVFETMFYGGIPETTEKTIELPDILPQAFTVMLKYLYTDVVEDLNMENVLPALYCANKYGIPQLADICAQYAVKNVDKDTCLAMLEAAQVLDAEDIVIQCLAVVDTHCSDLLQSPEFLQMTNETLRLIFSRDTLVAHERDIYKAAERWAVNACQTNHLKATAANCRRLLGPALFAIRFPLMDDTQLAKGPVANGLLRNDELRQIYQFKHAAKKPDILFSATPRSPHTVFCDRQWIVMGQWDTDAERMAARGVVLDESGHLHLRITQQNGVWKDAVIQSAEALGCGRYEFEIEGLDRLDPEVDFALYSQGRSEPGVGIQIAKSENNASSRNQVTFSVRRWVRRAPFYAGCTRFRKATVKDSHTVYAYHRTPASVVFTSRRDNQDNTTGDRNNWLCDFQSDISETALPVFMCLSCLPDSEPSDGKEVEIIVHSFRFYPDE